MPYKLSLTMDLLIKGLVTAHRTTHALEEMILGLVFKQWKFDCACLQHCVRTIID